MSEGNRHAGKPGEPGKRGTEHRGGEGGAGGVGGEGGFEGGPGGTGGSGGQMVGPRGPRGPTSRRALAGYLILCIGVTYAFWLTYRQGQENEEATIALCEIRAGLIRDVDRTDQLLDNDPGDIFGIPRNLIISGRNDDQDTIDTLGVLDC